MELLVRLYEHFRERAKQTTVANLTVGLSYTAVTTEDGGMGLAFTHREDSHCISLNRQYRDYEGERAIELLHGIKSPDPVHRSMGLALVNALNYTDALLCPEDSTNRIMMDALGIDDGTKVAMVGFFRPLMKDFEARGALVEVLDDSQGIGVRDDFMEKLSQWPDVLFLTSTSILNQSAEELLSQLRSGARTVMLGPSTPMVDKVFYPLRIHMLAGTVPIDKEGTLRAVRHGAGTPVIHRFSRKVCLKLM